jgi:hypothetical protein
MKLKVNLVASVCWHAQDGHTLRPPKCRDCRHSVDTGTRLPTEWHFWQSAVSGLRMPNGQLSQKRKRRKRQRGRMENACATQPLKTELLWDTMKVKSPPFFGGMVHAGQQPAEWNPGSPSPGSFTRAAVSDRMDTRVDSLWNLIYHLYLNSRIYVVSTYVQVVHY